MFIDIHVHAFRSPAPRLDDRRFSTPEQLLARYDALGIERGVVLPLVSPEFYLPQANEDVFEMAERYEGRFIPFCNIDPRAGNNSPGARLDKFLSVYKEMGAKGFGEITANLPFLHPMVQNLFGHLQDAGLPLIFHIGPQAGEVYGLIDDPGLPQLQRSLATFPKLKFFGHSPGFWTEIARLEKPGDRGGYPKYPIREEGVLPKMMRDYPNLYGDLSAGSGYNALARDRDYAVTFLTEFQDRMFFGTDICAPETSTPLVGFLLKLREEKKISEAVFHKIARENAIRVLEL